MHYQLVAKAADFTPEELKNKMLGFMSVSGESVHQFGDWNISEYEDFAAFCRDENLCDETYGTLAEQDGILRQYGFAYGKDHKIYEKTSVHFDSFEFKEIKHYQDVISSPQGVYAYISSAGQFYYVTDVRCPFEPDDVVYVMDCHN